MWILVTLPTVKEKSPEVYNWVLFLSWSLRNRKNITGFRVSDYCLLCLWVNTWSIFPTENSALFPAVYKEVHRSITGWNRITENILLFLEEGPSKSEVNRWSILIILIKNCLGLSLFLLFSVIFSSCGPHRVQLFVGNFFFVTHFVVYHITV